MPDPIIEPITIMVASIGPRARSKLAALLSISLSSFQVKQSRDVSYCFASFGSFRKFSALELLRRSPQDAPAGPVQISTAPGVSPVHANRLAREHRHLRLSIDRTLPSRSIRITLAADSFGSCSKASRRVSGTREPSAQVIAIRENFMSDTQVLRFASLRASALLSGANKNSDKSIAHDCARYCVRKFLVASRHVVKRAMWFHMIRPDAEVIGNCLKNTDLVGDRIENFSGASPRFVCGRNFPGRKDSDGLQPPTP